MLCSFRHLDGRFENKLSKNCTDVVTMIGASPVFHREAQLVLRFALPNPFLVERTVMLDHEVCVIAFGAPQSIAKHLSRLFDDAHVGMT